MFRHVALLIAFAVLPGGSSAEQRFTTVSIGAGGEKTMMTSQVREVVSAANGLRRGIVFEVRHTGGTYDNLKRLSAGEVAVALVSVDALKAGDAPPDTAVLWVQDAVPLVLAVRADLEVDGLSGLSGKRIVSGGAGSSLERFGPKVYESLGVKPKWTRSAWGQIAYLMKTNQVDGFIASPRMVQEVRSEYGVPDLKILRLGNDEVRKLSSLDPDIEMSMVMVEGMPVAAWGIRSAMISKDDLPDEVSESLARAALIVSRSKDDGSSVVRWLRDGTVRRLKLPVSPGSHRILREAMSSP
jgi:TRAP-type uncharacterized transport system substrate-binding protein